MGGAAEQQIMKISVHATAKRPVHADQVFCRSSCRESQQIHQQCGWADRLPIDAGTAEFSSTGGERSSVGAAIPVQCDSRRAIAIRSMTKGLRATL